MSTKVLIINDNDAFNEAVRRLLSDRSQQALVFAAKSMLEAQAAWRELKPDLVLLQMEQGSSRRAALIRKELPGAKIIGMALFNDDLNGYSLNDEEIFDGFISKECFAEQILSFIL